ncbi:MAG: adenylyltransferase/cytidyltransferase family protein [Candidatus Helarchaeota archaeon]
MDKKIRVMVFGTFDLLHIGHVTLLEKARELGGKDAELIVVIARDSSVLKEKGRPPIFNEKQRLALIQALKAVDVALLGNKDPDHFKIILDVKPDVIVLGYDQKVDLDALEKTLTQRGLKDFKVLRLEKYGEPGYNSSSSIKEKIKEKILENGF